jgi:GT2 family glycosyltransferase
MKGEIKEFSMLNVWEDVTVGIITHNSLRYLNSALESIKNAGCREEKILVVDVASRDNTGERVKEKYPNLRYIRLGENRGPNPARNLVIKKSESPYVFVMDADTEVMPDTLLKLRKAIREIENTGIASPVVVYKDRPEKIQYAGTFLHYLCEVVNPFQNKPVDLIKPGLKEIGVASACGLLIEREAAMRVGLFDEKYFFGKTDGEFTHRMRIAGYKIVEPSDCLILHTVKPRGTKYYSFQAMNRWHFILKNYQLRTLVVLAPILILHELLQFLLIVGMGEWNSYIRALSGFRKMMKGIAEERKKIAEIRRESDTAILSCGSFHLPENIMRNKFLRTAKKVYDLLLKAYWKMAYPFLPKNIFPQAQRHSNPPFLVKIGIGWLIGIE